MDDKVIVEFWDQKHNAVQDLEIPVGISAMDLCVALNEAFQLGIDTENVSDCYLVSEFPITFLRGNKLLSEFGIRNGSRIIYAR